MRTLQEQIVKEMGVAPKIDPAKEVEDRVLFLADYARAAAARSLVLGISGGVDSTLAGGCPYGGCQATAGTLGS